MWTLKFESTQAKMAGSVSGELRAPIFGGSKFNFLESLNGYNLQILWNLEASWQRDCNLRIKEENEGQSKEEEGRWIRIKTWGWMKKLMFSMTTRWWKMSKLWVSFKSVMSKETFPQIMNQDISKGAWDLLQEEFWGDEQARLVQLQSLWREFEYIRMKDNQIKSYGENLTHQREVQKVLISLPMVNDPIYVVIKRTSYLNTFTTQEVVRSLKSYEEWLNRHVKDAMNILQAWVLLQRFKISLLFMAMLAKQRKTGNQNPKSGKPRLSQMRGKLVV